jgi:hypothetical protein
MFGNSSISSHATCGRSATRVLQLFVLRCHSKSDNVVFATSRGTPGAVTTKVNHVFGGSVTFPGPGGSRPQRQHQGQRHEEQQSPIFNTRSNLNNSSSFFVFYNTFYYPWTKTTISAAAAEMARVSSSMTTSHRFTVNTIFPSLLWNATSKPTIRMTSIHNYWQLLLSQLLAALNQPRFSFPHLNDDGEVSGALTTVRTTFVLATSSSSATTTWLLSILEIVLDLLQTLLRRTWNLLLVSWRVTEVAVLLSPLLVLAPVAILFSYVSEAVTVATNKAGVSQDHNESSSISMGTITSSVAAKASTLLSDLSWLYAIHAIQLIGPVAIKFCQWVATRRDIFPPELCHRLGILHDRGYPHPWHYTHRTLQHAFGDDYQTTGGLIVAPHDVIGCGSAAQVYRAKLRIQAEQHYEDGETYRDVAIKVLHPNFQEMVDRDLDLIRIIADFLHSLPIKSIRLLNLPHAVEDFSIVLHNQSDLTIEAENLRRFRKNFFGRSSSSSAKTESEDNNWHVVFPQPIEGWTSSKVLVEDYVPDAAPIADFLRDSSKEGMEIRRELAGTYIIFDS